VTAFALADGLKPQCSESEEQEFADGLTLRKTTYDAITNLKASDLIGERANVVVFLRVFVKCFNYLIRQLTSPFNILDAHFSILMAVAVCVHLAFQLRIGANTWQV